MDIDKLDAGKYNVTNKWKRFNQKWKRFNNREEMQKKYIKGERMILKQQSDTITLTCEDSKYVFLPGGDIREFTSGQYMLNQFVGTCMDGSANNIYLKVGGSDDGIFPLLGCRSESRIFTSDGCMIYQGCVKEITYKVIFTCASGGIWFWKVELQGNGENVQLIYGQDVGVGDRGGIRTNELYLSQYLDHFIDEGEFGYTVCSRQNQCQGGHFPYLQQGCLDKKIIGYSTDAMQFFGKKYKKTEQIEALYGKPLQEKYQYELSYIALWTEPMILDSPKTAVFYGIFKEDMETPVRHALYMDDIRRAYDSISWQLTNITLVAAPSREKAFGQPYASAEMTEKELDAYFPERILEEKKEGRLLSFFKKNHTHVVLQEKELLVERPHGNIITTLPDERIIRKDLMTSTNFIYGLFHAQTVIGNTDSNRLLCANRGLLNIQKYTGQRIWVKIGEHYRVLTLPAAYEMALNYSRWYYKIDDDMLIITAEAMADAPVVKLQGYSVKGRSYDFIITSQLSMGNGEFNDEIRMETSENLATIYPVDSSAIKRYYPDLAYQIEFPEGADISDDRIFYNDHIYHNGTLVTASFSGNAFSSVMRGTLDGRWRYESRQENDSIEDMAAEPERELEKYLDFYKKFKGGFHIGFVQEASPEPGDIISVEKLNVLTSWYVHNAFVHFYVPRGLEQCSGAAWGTRDVCQGPMELFLTTGHFELARAVLLEIFAHQNADTKEWPQWFMFDQYPYMAGDCHGDVIFWPLKCLGDYLEYTKDRTILDEEIPYRYSDGRLTQEYTVSAHLKMAIEAVKDRFVGDTALISYAGGDWDDTLQPADPAMKERLISAWTQALAYQAVNQLAVWLRTDSGDRPDLLAGELKNMAQAIREDFNRYLIKDDVIAGFAYRENDGRFSYMLHPLDEKTGIRYRLLPLTRSIISRIADEEQARKNVELIDEHLTFPDGVRLMDRPARYDGGVSRYFQRAEQAANVGREISLQYVHAHIRYIEAMSVYGDGEKVFENLMKIVPINIKDNVANALPRQNNAYFSSSEGNFKDRYEYADKFELLKTGEIDVKGGWRIYSSGPGIFLGRLIGNMLGIRQKTDVLEIDPVLSRKLDGLTFDYECFGKCVRFVYHVEEDTSGVKKIVCDDEELAFVYSENRYRTGGAVIRMESWMKAIERCSEVHVFI